MVLPKSKNIYMPYDMNPPNPNPNLLGNCACMVFATIQVAVYM